MLILFWQFTIRTLEELEIVSNQNLSIEIFLMRLIYLSSKNIKEENFKKKDLHKTVEKENLVSDFKSNTIDQIKSVTQEKKNTPEIQTEIKAENDTSINSFKKLIEVCTQNKEMKLKYELEKNVNLVSFENNRVEISFNDNLDNSFVKELSLKLFEWTGQRWIITFSKTKGDISIKEKEENKKIKLFEKTKNTEIYKNVLKKFPDAKLVKVNTKKD